ncbi:hypothetical protein HF086_008192 [Spodoptera exigua]|uniref:Ebony n=1 Tax=Spodoptera exigua TaxID=7107 RepID=A0A922M538_SPOEX|nr:hypothetical protein HF086_008192 [Spodoptera exigua]
MALRVPLRVQLLEEEHVVPSVGAIIKLVFVCERSNLSILLSVSDETCSVRVSYTELEARTNALARAITSRAGPKGANRDGDYVIAVCMQPTHKRKNLFYILNLSIPANPAMFSGSGIPAVSFEELSHEAGGLSADAVQDVEVLAPARSESIAIVLYTSGSTGIPKGVRLPYSAICNRLWWQFQTFPYSDTEVHCVWKTALTFVDSVCEIWGPLLHGRTLVILSRETTRDPQKLVNVLADNQIQRLVLVPTLLRSILMYLSLKPNEKPLQHLKLWVCSGETLSKELAAQFFKNFGDRNGYKLANFYGSTEVMGDVTYYVLENTRQLDAHPTIPIDFARLYRTGDFGVLQKGVILYAGRTDSQIKIRGHRVDLQEVDRAVAGVSGVDKCVVLCYGLDRGNPEILAFVTIKPEARIAAHHIEAALKNSLTHYMIPQVIEVESIPLLVNGKVDRQALLKMYENTNNNDDSEIPLELDYSSVSPSDMQAAKVLFETVGEVLGRAARGAISVRAGFYELGGNSLNSIYTITRLRDKGYYIDISDFLGASNLGEVLSHMTTSPQQDDDGKELFSAEPLADEHKKEVIEMIVSSFYNKAELEQFLKHEIDTNDYAVLISDTWPALIDAQLSVVLKNSSGVPVAVALNFDARDEPDVESEETGGTILHSFMMATAESLTPRENVSAIRALEHATMNIAKERGFHGVFTTNTSPLTQQLGTDVLGYQTLLDYQINQYVDPNGDRIFGKAPDDMRAVVCWKPLE